MKLKATAVAALGLLCLRGALAGPLDYVITPTVEAGEKEIDFKYGSSQSHPRETQASLGFGYGVNDWWFTEAYVKYAKSGGGTHFDAFEWENKFQLTETGKYPVDVGFIMEIEIPEDRNEGIELKVGPLLQTEFGLWQLNGNLLFEKHYDATPKGVTEMGYQWQVKYRWRPALEFGLQGLGNLGEWNDWNTHDNQDHKAGPALFGKLTLAGHQTLRYNAAWLFGLTNGAPDHTFRLQAEIEF